MTLPATLRKPKLHFDTAANPSHVTFDDGWDERRNLPWSQYVVTLWHYAEPDTIKMEIGDCLVVICGHNLLPLFQAIEDRTLTRVRAQPNLENAVDRVSDSFATEIRFTQRAAGGSASQPGQIEFTLGE